MKKLFLALLIAVSISGYSQRTNQVLASVNYQPKELLQDQMPNYILSDNIDVNGGRKTYQKEETNSRNTNYFRQAYYQNSGTSFNKSNENFERFKNSPCYSKLGFIPGYDNERIYKECEDEYYKEKYQPILIIAVIGIIITIIFLKSKRK